MMTEFKEGDTVRLKSGSARMTITAVESSVACCVWMSYGVNDYKSARIPVAALVLDGVRK